MPTIIEQSNLNNQIKMFIEAFTAKNLVVLNELNSSTFNTACELEYLTSHVFNKLEEDFFNKNRICNASIISTLRDLKGCNISLNPRTRQATIMLTKNIKSGLEEIHLYPTYIGLRDIAVGKGVILNAVASLVYSEDTFVWHGHSTAPVHTYDPFSKTRGELRGGICRATLPNGELIVSAINREELEKSFRMAQSPESKSLWQERTDQMLLAKVLRFSSCDWPNNKPIFEHLN
ncbi:recombinase RecT [Shewanella sp. SG44-6]|jgi:recombination protein RecT|uniref:recombinase RecT n=1 Tax=Shewanella sp. SG44-6 TaxID=2760959 RepID=UPI0016015690|nr:recombinase RecT [Shewanella sp. SG44-6]MBB1390217.1 recombinase RecT [Shewanella sp. SG44-6]